MPYDRLEVCRGLERLAFLIGLLPEPVVMEDGLSLVTA
jgi:hypothetical protein